MKEKRGWKLVRNNLLSLFLVLSLIVLAAVFAGDVVVKEGDVDINDDLNVSGILYVNSTLGKVGIGTTTPNYLLEVDGTSDFGNTMTFGNGAIGTISWGTMGGGSGFGIMGGSGRSLSFGAGGTWDKMVINALTGNVGIGTTSPSEKLTVIGNVNITDGNISIYRVLGGGIYDGRINFGHPNPSVNSYLFYKNIGSGRTVIANENNAGGNNNDIVIGFGSVDGSSGYPSNSVMTIEQSGKVGIGISNPDTTLHINNIMKITPTDSPSACSIVGKGSIYFDDSLSEPCFCNGTNWIQFDSGGSC